MQKSLILYFQNNYFNSIEAISPLRCDMTKLGDKKIDKKLISAKFVLVSKNLLSHAVKPMKTIIISLILFFGLTFLSGVFVAKTLADAYSPLDFSHNYEKFEVKVGFDHNNGRYYTYHYEF